MHGSQVSTSQIPHLNAHADGLLSQYAIYYYSAATAQQGTSYSPVQAQMILPRCSPQVGAYRQQQNGLQNKESSSSSKQHTRSNRRTLQDTPHFSPLGTSHPPPSHRQQTNEPPDSPTTSLPPRSSDIPRKHSTQGRLRYKDIQVR